MKTMKFCEYMNSKGKIDKPVVQADGDRVDPMTPPNKAPEGQNYKCSDGKPKKAKESGFGDEGDPKLKYMPKTETPKGKAPAKLPTVEQVEKTSLFTKAVKKDPTMIETLVRQFSNNNLLGPLVAELCENRDTFKHLSEIMSHKEYGPEVCTKLVRAMNEEVAQPFSSQLDDTEMDDPTNNDQSDGEGIDDDDLGLSDDEDDFNLGMDDINADPNMMGADPLMNGQPMHPAMQNFQRAMMRNYQKAMMSKQ